MKGWVIAGAVLAALFVIGALSSSDEPGRAGPACEHFHNVAVDYSDGVLSAMELREKLKEVDSSARGSQDPAVENAARDMLAAPTQGDSVGFDDAASAMSDACDPYRD